MQRVVRHWGWCQRAVWLLRAPPCPHSGTLEQLSQLTRPWAVWCLLVLLLLWLFAVDSCCFPLKFNSVCIWKYKGENLLFLLEAELHWRLDDDPLFMLLQNPTKWGSKHKRRGKYNSDLPNSLRIIRRLAIWHCLLASCELNVSHFSLYISVMCHFSSGFHVLLTHLTPPSVNRQNCILLHKKRRRKHIMWHQRLSNCQSLKCAHICSLLIEWRWIASKLLLWMQMEHLWRVVSVIYTVKYLSAAKCKRPGWHLC